MPRIARIGQIAAKTSAAMQKLILAGRAPLAGRTGYPTGGAAAPGAIAGVEVIGARRRISRGAIFAGVIVVLAIQLLLSMLGLGVGLSFVNPAEGN